VERAPVGLAPEAECLSYFACPKVSANMRHYWYLSVIKSQTQCTKDSSFNGVEPLSANCWNNWRNFAVDGMKTTKTAESHSGSEAWARASAMPWVRAPFSPLPKAALLLYNRSWRFWFFRLLQRTFWTFTNRQHRGVFVTLAALSGVRAYLLTWHICVIFHINVEPKTSECNAIFGQLLFTI